VVLVVNIEPKLRRKRPVKWEGHVALTPGEVEQILQHLPDHLAIREALADTLIAAKLRAQELNQKDPKQ
jgi:hypothetical protein